MAGICTSRVTRNWQKPGESYRRVLLRATTYGVVAVVFEALHGGFEDELRQAAAPVTIPVLSAVPYLRARRLRMGRAVVVDGDEDVAINGPGETNAAH
jgi:hypothetical protein